MLHIGIHQHHRIGIAMVEPGADRVFLAEVAAEVDHLDARIALMLRQKLGQGVAGRLRLSWAHYRQSDAQFEVCKAPASWGCNQIGLRPLHQGGIRLNRIITGWTWENTSVPGARRVTETCQMRIRVAFARGE